MVINGLRPVLVIPAISGYLSWQKLLDTYQIQSEIML